MASRRRCWRVRRGGFTLIELLVVTCIIGVLSAAIVGCFAAGVRLWDAARAFGGDEGEATLALLEAERDLRNALPVRVVPFAGDAHTLTMAGLVRDEREPGTVHRVLGSIRYRFDPADGKLLKQTWPYPAPPPADREGIAIAKRLESFTCRYYEAEAAQWLDQWEDPSNMPTRVSLDLACTSGVGRIVLHQEIGIPLAAPAREDTGAGPR